MDGVKEFVASGTWASEDDTAAFGRALAAHAQPGDAVALVGDLGTGKTTLSRYIAAALAVDVANEFSSPTYCYANEYQGRLPVVHMDFYRVHDEDMAESLGLLELVARRDAVLLIEWANKLPRCLPQAALWLTLLPSAELTSGEHARSWQARGPRDVVTRLLGDVASQAGPL